MERKFFVKLFFLVVVGCVFTGCSTSGLNFFSNGNSKVGNKEQKDNTGTGLNMDFNVDIEDISTGRLYYNVRFLNDGIDEIELSRSNFKLIYPEEYKGNSVIDENIIESFYKRVLGDEEKINLVQNVDWKRGGVLKINEGYLNSNIEEFDLILKAFYSTKTEFLANLNIVIDDYGMHKIGKIDGLSQAAPLQVNDLKLVSDFENGKYNLEVQIGDKGHSLASGADYGGMIEINNFNLKFGDNEGVVCSLKSTGIDDDNLDVIKIKKKSSVILVCPISIVSEKGFSTQISGSFDYDYDVTRKVSVDISSLVRD